MWKHSLPLFKYLFSRNSYVCPKRIFIFDTFQGQIYSACYRLLSQIFRSTYVSVSGRGCGLVLFCPRAPLNICLFNTSYTILYIVEEVGERESRRMTPSPPPPRRSLFPGYYLEKWEVGECWKDSTVLV